MPEPASHRATWAACKMGGASECVPLRSQSDSKNASKRTTLQFRRRARRWLPNRASEGSKVSCTLVGFYRSPTLVSERGGCPKLRGTPSATHAPKVGQSAVRSCDSMLPQPPPAMSGGHPERRYRSVSIPIAHVRGSRVCARRHGREVSLQRRLAAAPGSPSRYRELQQAGSARSGHLSLLG